MNRFLTITLLGISTLANSQEITLNPVTITSTVLEHRITETGRNIAVIQGKDIHKLPGNSLDEILRFVPGIEVQSRGPLGTQSDFVLRGGTFQQVLVILDGIRVNDPTTGHFSSYIPILASEIERIEVLKGSSSAIYGSEAVGGVINVISKKFHSKKKAENRLESNIATGEHGLLNLQSHYSHNFNKLNISLGGSTINTTGDELRGTKGYVHNHMINTSANYQFNEKWNIAARSAWDKRDFNAQNYYTTFSSDTASEKVTSTWNQLQTTYQTNKTNIQLIAGYKKTNDKYWFNDAATPNNNDSHLGQLLLKWQQQIATHTELVTGVNYQYKKIVSNDRGNHDLQQFAPFVTLSHQIGNFNIHPAIRLDWRENIGTEVVPQLSMAYRLKSLHFRTSLGKSIRDADFTERYNNYNKALVTGGTIGNPNLKAEKSFNIELGADWFILPTMKLSATAFQRNQKNLIDYISTLYVNMPRKENLAPTGSFALAQNLLEVQTKGIEIDLNARFTLSEKQSIQTALGITFLDSDSENNQPSFYVSSHAKQLINGSVLYRYNKFNCTISGVSKKRNPQENAIFEVPITTNYTVLNTKLSYNLCKNIAPYLQVDNIFNKKYSDLLGARMPSRWVMAGVRIVL